VKFSVIIPVYNKEPHVARSIESVLGQTHPDFELIIVNDASTDNSMEEVAKFEDPRIRIFNRDIPGPGGYAARNLGISKANNEWVTFLDADDEYLPNHLEQLSEVIKKFPDKNLFTSSRLAIQNKIKTPDKYYKHLNTYKVRIISFSEYLNYCFKGLRPINTNSICIRKKSIRSSLFPAGRVKRSGDLYTWVKLLAKFNFIVWSPHFGSVSDRDVEGVSSHTVPSMQISKELVNELMDELSRKEVKLLKRYANRMIFRAYIEQIRITGTSEKPLFSTFYWDVSPLICLKWYVSSLIPKYLKKIK
jgi:succinoglycan biosynthesis protein ExoO